MGAELEIEAEEGSEAFAEVLGTSRALIPNDLAKALFNARRDVVRCETGLESAQLVVKDWKLDLARYQSQVMELIREAESGQTQLFKAEGEGDEDAGEATEGTA